MSSQGRPLHLAYLTAARRAWVEMFVRLRKNEHMCCVVARKCYTPPLKLANVRVVPVVEETVQHAHRQHSFLKHASACPCTAAQAARLLPYRWEELLLRLLPARDVDIIYSFLHFNTYFCFMSVEQYYYCSTDIKQSTFSLLPLLTVFNKKRKA